MNVFVLSTGRCGSTTFAMACAGVENYTTGHESQRRRAGRLDVHRYRDLDYPDRHIEVDNRLSWFLGELEERYGDDAFYVHLLRDRGEVARSFLGRWEQRETNIIFSFAWGVLTHPFSEIELLSDPQKLDIAGRYWDTVNGNIRAFLAGKPRQITMWLHDIRDPFRRFWEEIGAAGDLDLALAAWETHHNESTAGGRSRRGPARSSAGTPDAGLTTGTDSTALPELGTGERGDRNRPPEGEEGVDAILELALQGCGEVDLTVIRPRPVIGQWSLGADTLRYCVSLVGLMKPRHVVELGSGVSTRVLSWALQAGHPQARLTSIDHDSLFLEETRRQLARQQRAAPVSFILAPLVTRNVGGGTRPVYLLPPDAFSGAPPADLVLVDGPPSSLGGRSGTLHQIMDFAKVDTVVLLDDALRSEEAALILEWERQYGSAIQVTRLEGFAKGLAAIRIVEPVGSSRLSEHTAAIARGALEKSLTPGSKWVVVDDGVLDLAELSGATVLPFLERDGEYQGPAASDEQAIRELERMRGEGACYLAIMESSRWWLDHYALFAEHLTSNYPCLSSSPWFRVFDLRADSAVGGPARG